MKWYESQMLNRIVDNDTIFSVIKKKTYRKFWTSKIRPDFVSDTENLVRTRYVPPFRPKTPFDPKMNRIGFYDTFFVS